MKIYLYFIVMLFIPLISLADEVYLKDDTLIKGTIIRVDPNEVEINTKGEKPLMGGERADENTIIIKRTEIRRIVYDDGKEIKLSGGENAVYKESDENLFDKDTKISDAPGGDYLFSLSAGINKMSGHTTYQIGGKVDTPEGSGYQRFPTSELEFPLNVYMFTINAAAKLFENWKVNCKYNRSITSDAGKMKDSDWGINYNEISWWGDPNSLDIYSESDAHLDAWIAEADISYMFMKIHSGDFVTLVSAGAGYIYQNFYFEVSNLDQWYPSMNNYYGYDVGHDRQSGLVGTYEVTSSIPYFELAFEMNYREILYIDMSLGYSPFVKVNDDDHHLLREPVLISKAKCDGNAKLFSIGARCFMPRIVFVEIKYEYISVDTDGREKDWEGGVYTATIDQKNFSKRMNYELAIGGELRI